MNPLPPQYLDLLVRLDHTRSAGVELGLDRTRAVLQRLGNPQRRAPTVHIAGTNGKGSTAAMTEAILRAAGFRTGLYTSPHLSRFTERIRVDGREVDGDVLAALDERVRDAQRGAAPAEIPLTYFEVATVLAFLMFAEAGVEVVVAETGLGGRLDATTTCEPVATAITSIAVDHAELLGSTPALIAREKAGIAKPGVPLLLGPVPPEADREISAIAAAVGAPLLRWGTDFTLPAGVSVGLPGKHQTINAALAVALARIAAAAVPAVTGRGPLAREAIVAGLRDVVWPGRLEWLDGDVLTDCAHNVEGALALASALDGMSERRPRALVFSAVEGKPAGEMLRILAPRFDAAYLTQSSNPRALTTTALASVFPMGTKTTCEVHEIPHSLTALGEARRFVGTAGDAAARGQASGMVVAAGSTFLVGDLRAALLGEQRDLLPTSDPLFAAMPQNAGDGTPPKVIR